MTRAGIMMMGLLLPLAPAWGAEPTDTLKWQVTPFAGYSSSIKFEAEDEAEPVSTATIDTLHGESSGSWGLFISKEVDNPGMVELLYSHQSTILSPEQPDELTVDHLQFAGALTLSDGLMAPYVGAGIGLTRFAAFESKVAPSMSLALGIQPRLANNLALRAEVRGYGAIVNDDTQFLCNPEVCLFRMRGDLVTQWQANVGLTFRF